MASQQPQQPTLGQALQPNIWDVVALILVVGAMVLIVYGGEQTTLPLSALDVTPVSLDPANLPVYALRTTMRMLLAIVCSIIFTFIYAALAAKSRRAEMVLIPLLDILQSVPILGFLTFTADSGDCGHGFRLNATMQSDRRRPPVPTKAAGVSLPA